MHPVHRVALSGIFVALGVAVGFLLASVPNIELVTFIIFIGGVCLGAFSGAVVGGTTFFLFSLFNPYGIAPLPLLVLQILSGIIIGVSGGMLGRLGIRRLPVPMRFVIGAAFGFLLTLVYDILTNIGAYIAAGTPDTFWAFIISGLSFSVIHIVSNALIFAVLFPALVSRLPDTLWKEN